MLKKTLSEIEFKNLNIAGGGREEPVLPPAQLVAQSKQASFGRWKSFEGLGRTKEACSKSSHWKVTLLLNNNQNEENQTPFLYSNVYIFVLAQSMLIFLVSRIVISLSRCMYTGISATCKMSSF